MLDTSEDPYVPSQRSVHAAGGPMGWSTKVAIGGVIHGSQVNRHPPHHPPSSYSLVGARLEHFTLIVRMYGFEGEAGREGEGFTRIRESSHRRLASQVNSLLFMSNTESRIDEPVRLSLWGVCSTEIHIG